MAAWGLAVTSVLALGAAVLYVSVGLLVLRRRPGPPLAAPNAAFGAGWMMFGLVIVGDGLRIAMGILSDPWLPLYVALVEAKIILTAAALAAFGFYVAYLWTGRMWTWIPMALLGLAHAFFFLTITLMAAPFGVDTGTWATRLTTQPTGLFPGGKAVGAAAFFLPFLVLTVFYLALWPRATTLALRARLAAVSVSLILFLLAASIQSNPDVSPDTPLLPLAWVVIGLAGLLSIWAFAPPAWLRRRLPDRDEAPMTV